MAERASVTTPRRSLRAGRARAAGAAPRARGGAARAAPARERFTSSLIPEVEAYMDTDAESLELQEKMKLGQAALSARESADRQQALQRLDAPEWRALMERSGVTELRRAPASVLQLNIGLYCNQACTHCHVESSPRRTEWMNRRTAARCIELLRRAPSVRTLDLTGGAPELNPEFRYLVESASDLDVEIIDRCNLTVLMEPGQEDLADFLARHKVRVVASMPCYSKDNVDQQRGGGVFRRSIAGLRKLNEVGYGRPGTGLVLDLVYNPNGDFLAPPQHTLEPAYRAELRDAFGIEFSTLLCLNNMPIKRFWDYLEKRGKLESYMQLLVDNFNPAAGESVMCRDTVSVAWDGRIYDCDFNQQLAMGMAGKPADFDVHAIESLDELSGLRVACGNHCYGCTAGSGFSCSGQ